MRIEDRNSKANLDKNEKKLLQFLEELSWLLERNSDINFRNISRNVNDLLTSRRQSSFILDNSSTSEVLKELEPTNPNKLLLVGILPLIFTDEKLFQSNEDIADFAICVLDVQIPGWNKRSKFELIGHIVCHTAIANEKKLGDIASVLKKISENEKRTKRFILQKRIEKKNWNEIIQLMLAGEA